MGHDVIVANPRKERLITQSVKKNDRMDAEQLARLARVDPKLLAPIRHRGAEAQGDLAIIRARAEVVECRTKLINAARGLTKPMGERLKSCDADSVKESLADGHSEATQAIIRPLLKLVESITQQIQVYDQKIQEMEKRYPETKLLKQVHGVGRLIALSFILTLEDAERFAHSRDVGPDLGLTRKLRESGESQPELGISQAGDGLMRRLLVQAAHCILREGVPDSDLKAWGMTKVQAGAGKKGSKKRKTKAAVAVARKLAVLLHRLWVTGEVYDPQYNRKAVEAAKGKKPAAA
jgi:transposase